MNDVWIIMNQRESDEWVEGIKQWTTMNNNEWERIVTVNDNVFANAM